MVARRILRGEIPTKSCHGLYRLEKTCATTSPPRARGKLAPDLRSHRLLNTLHAIAKKGADFKPPVDVWTDITEPVCCRLDWSSRTGQQLTVRCIVFCWLRRKIGAAPWPLGPLAVSAPVQEVCPHRRANSHRATGSRQSLAFCDARVGAQNPRVPFEQKVEIVHQIDDL
jgi:hypothetical protein